MRTTSGSTSACAAAAAASTSSRRRLRDQARCSRRSIRPLVLGVEPDLLQPRRGDREVDAAVVGGDRLKRDQGDRLGVRVAVAGAREEVAGVASAGDEVGAGLGDPAGAVSMVGARALERAIRRELDLEALPVVGVVTRAAGQVADRVRGDGALAGGAAGVVGEVLQVYVSPPLARAVRVLERDPDSVPPAGSRLRGRRGRPDGRPWWSRPSRSRNRRRTRPRDSRGSRPGSARIPSS